MALITVSGQPGCRHEEAARLAAQLLHFELLTEARLREMIAEEFGGETAVPDRAFPEALLSILARLATEHHLVVATAGAELLLKSLPGVLRVAVVGPEARRVGTLMLEHRLDRPVARQLLRSLEAEQRAYRKRRFGRASAPACLFDLVFNSESLDPEQVAQLIEAAARARGLPEQGLLSATAEAHLQFRVRLRLSKHGIVPPGKASFEVKHFSHPSEEIFANLLDFYRVAWEYEPRSFPVQWDKDGKVLEAFTPDFYLPEFDLYVELTTMKQSLVTKKNRKVKLLRAIYPHLNIQVFYQKDFENLIFKYGLAERAVKA
jgi:cytidylate kinase